jgi:integral membrane protein (TIGR01906 family)
LLLLGAILLFVLFGFGVFFVGFHEVLFPAGSWTFEYSDTLIRLFPERFWRDVFTIVAILPLAGGLALILGLRRGRL